MTTDEPGDPLETALREALEAERARFSALSSIIIAIAEKRRRVRQLASEIGGALDERDFVKLGRLAAHADPREYVAAFGWAYDVYMDNVLLWCRTAFGVTREQEIEVLKVEVTPEALAETMRRASEAERAKQRHWKRVLRGGGLLAPELNYGRTRTFGRTADDDDWHSTRDSWRPLDAVWDPDIGGWRPMAPDDALMPIARGFPGVSFKPAGVSLAHGTYIAYKRGGCRCAKCRAANAAYVRDARASNKRNRKAARSSVQAVDAAARAMIEDRLGFTVEQMRNVYWGRAGGSIPRELRPLRDAIDARLLETLEEGGIAQLARATGLSERTLQRAVQRAKAA